MNRVNLSLVCISAIAWTCFGGLHAGRRAEAAGPSGPAALITTHARVPGGLCVVIGSDQTEAAIALGGSGRFLVQVLEADSGKLEAARSQLR